MKKFATVILFSSVFCVHGFAPISQKPLHVKIHDATEITDASAKILHRSPTSSLPPSLDTNIAPRSRTVLSSSTARNGLEPEDDESEEFSYTAFAKAYPFTNNIAIASTKTAFADLIAQVVIAQTPVSEVDWARAFLFFMFGALYSGGFQYVYQVQVFKRLFDVDSFTSQPWADKFKDVEGLKQLAAQTVLDLTVLTLVYLPAFYIFKASVFSGSPDPSVWTNTGLDNYSANFAKDEFDALRVWLPADLVCFSVALYLRLPVRHIVSFGWTAYLSFMHGGH